MNRNQLICELLKDLSNKELKILVEYRKLSKPYLIPPPPQFREKPIPAQRTNSVKQIVREYEDNIIPSPTQFRDGLKPIPGPRTKKPIPIPAPRTKMEQTNEARKGYTKSFEITLKNDKDPLVQLQNTRKVIENHFKSILSDTKGFKFV